MNAEKWEQVFLAQSMDAAVGRMFRGIVHNLNGVIQVFSLQTDLFGMMMQRSLANLHALEKTCTAQESAELIGQLLETIGKRAGALAQMQEKVNQSQALLHRALILPDFSQIPGIEPYSVSTVVQTEVEFLCADPFFKHKVDKELNLAQGLPAVNRGLLELHQLVHLVLVNTVDALQGRDDARVRVEASQEDQAYRIVIEDNGPGIAPENLDRIFEPFFTTRADHPGVGLYLAKKLAAGLNGELRCESRPGSTRFSLMLPV